MTNVHVVTIRKPQKADVVAGGHVVHQIGNEGLSQRRSLQGMHQFDGAEVLSSRNGRVVHTPSAGDVP